MAVPSTRMQEEQARLQRQRELQANREYLTRLNAAESRRNLEIEERNRERQRQFDRQQEAARRRAEAAEVRTRAALATRPTGYSQFTPPQSFIAGNAATRISGAPNLLDVLIALVAAGVGGAWVVTRNHATGGDLGWAAFLALLGVGLMVEGHGELHDAGVGLAGGQAAYIAIRLIGGTKQPGT